MSTEITVVELLKIATPVFVVSGSAFVGALWKLSSDISRLQANQRNIQDQMISQKEFYDLLSKMDSRISKIEALLIKER